MWTFIGTFVVQITLSQIIVGTLWWGYDEHDKGNIYYVDDYDKTDKDYEKIEYEYHYPTSIHYQGICNTVSKPDYSTDHKFPL